MLIEDRSEKVIRKEMNVDFINTPERKNF